MYFQQIIILIKLYFVIQYKNILSQIQEKKNYRHYTKEEIMKPNQLNLPHNLQNKMNKNQKSSDLESVTVKNIFLDTQCDIGGIKNRNNIRMPLKNLRPHRQKIKKDLLGAFPELPNQIKKDACNREPEIPIEKMKRRKGDNLISLSQNSKKKTFLLNSIIQILQNKDISTIDNDNKVASKLKPKIKTEPDYANQFAVQLNPVTFKNSRGPRIIENSITKLHNNHDNLLQRKIFSEEKNRKRPQRKEKHAQSLSKVDNFEKNVQLLTFYKPKQQKLLKNHEEDRNQFIEMAQQ